MNLDNIKSKLLEIFKIIINLPVLGIIWAVDGSPDGNENKEKFVYFGNLLVLWVFIIACIVGLW